MNIGRNAFYNLIGGVIPVAGALVTVPMYVHLIGAARYGVLSIAWVLLGYFGLFDLGLGRATSFRIAALSNGSPQDRATTFWSAVAVNLAMGTAGGAILWAAARLLFFQHFQSLSRSSHRNCPSCPATGDFGANCYLDWCLDWCDAGP